MYNYLIDHALKNVWCTPDQDTQSIMQLARLTPKEGVWSRVQIMWREYVLPEPQVRFHVYQIGQIHPLLLGLLTVREKWVTLAKSCNDEKMIVDLFVASGIEFPRTQAWFMVTRDKNLVVAVKAQKSIPVDLGYFDLNMRVYSNAYFNSDRSDPLDDFVRVEGGLMQTRNQIIELQTKFERYQALRGQVYAFVNGMKVHAINLLTVKIDDTAEFVYDSSIYKVMDFKIADLKTFESTLDQRAKYLLHVAGTADDNIDYQDDIDVFLIEPTANNGHSGVYYHRKALDALRNLTHRDYSIPVQNLLSFTLSQTPTKNLNNMYLRLHFRRGGYNRPLVNEHNRIKELYKLKDLDIRKAMLGVDAVVPNWQADTLESAAYAKIMRIGDKQITEQLVEDAYGYNAIAKLIGDTPSNTRSYSGLTLVDMPYGLQTNATVWEYDANGLLLGFYNHAQGAVYACTNRTAKRVEVLSGLAGDLVDQFYGDVEITIDPNLNYRFYTAPIVAGVVGKVWTDVTDSSKYDIVNGKVHWMVDRTKYQTIVRTDARVLAYSFTMQPNDGVFLFTLNNSEKRGTVTSKRVMEILMGELDVFLNGRSLVEGVDYFRVGNQIMIICKKHMVNVFTAPQKITVRFSGFCLPSGELAPRQDAGFVDHGMLSRNRRYDIRDDKVLRIIAGGRLYDRTELEFSEDDSGVYPRSIVNGTPYQIRDIVVPMRNLTPTDTYALRERSIAVDQAISDYMTIKLPEPVIENPNIIPERYEVVSPFIQKILSDLQTKVLDDDRLYGHFNDTVVFELCKPYEYLLAFDPTQETSAVDPNYVTIHPHLSPNTVDMGIYQNRFLARVVKLYSNGLIDLAPFIRVEKY